MTREEEMTEMALAFHEKCIGAPSADNPMTYEDAYVQGWKDADEHPKNQWLNAGKELPKNHQDEGCDYSEKILLRVQVGTFVHYVEGGYDFKNKRWCIELHGEATEISHVTHWMPIQEPLKGGEA